MLLLNSLLNNNNNAWTTNNNSSSNNSKHKLQKLTEFPSIRNGNNNRAQQSSQNAYTAHHIICCNIRKLHVTGINCVSSE